VLRLHSTTPTSTPTPTHQTRLYPYVQHVQFSREESRVSVSWNVAFTVAVQLPAVNKASRYFHSMEYNLARDENARLLNPYQHAYLLLDNGRDKPLDCAHDFRKQFDHYLSSIKTHGNGMSTNTDCIQYIREVISTTYHSVKCS